ncbi:MAG: 3-hydroxyacyl-ACP dehydratase FabZ [Caldicoprobacterales bacterium]|jgi:3-hydroxyacyl-[acyl-carrier-protein] dehydratase|nr:3-hydroxyacyl-ACP dehydratase FabZ [Clostridiales bacterium]
MTLDINEIIKRIPHRYPFLLIDRVTELIPGEYARGYKNVTANEPFFQGHFPGYPVMPGVLILEALAQLGATVILGEEKNQGKLALFTGIDSVRFRKQVIPGDKLDLEVRVLRVKNVMGKAAVKASVEGEVAAEGEIMFALSAPSIQ